MLTIKMLKTTALLAIILGGWFWPGYSFGKVETKLEPALNRLAHAIEENDFRVIHQTRLALESRVYESEANLKLATEYLRKNHEQMRLRNELVAVLTLKYTPVVEQMALAFLKDNNHTKQLIGLEVLSVFGGKSRTKGQPLAVKIICQANQKTLVTSDLVSAALSLYDSKAFKNEQKSIQLECFNRLAKSEYESIRSESLFNIARLASNPGELAPVISAMKSPIFDIKMSALIALQESSVLAQEVKVALLDIATNSDEKSEFRTTARKLLGRFELTEKDKARLVMVSFSPREKVE